MTGDGSNVQCCKEQYESDGKICLEKQNDSWAVFFCEGTKKIGTMLFQDENSACARMLREISKVMDLLREDQRSFA